MKKTTSQSPVSPIAAEQHAGEWVALRGREVSASAPTYPQLQEDPRVRPTDAVYHVPPANTQSFVAMTGPRLPVHPQREFVVGISLHGSGVDRRLAE